LANDHWLGIELRHLAALEAVAREGSFSRAATRLGYVQSAISHQIAALEALVGERLIERSRGTRPLALTDAGEILLGHSDGILSRIKAAQADLSALANGSAGTLRVGTFPNVSTRILPPLLRNFSDALPGVEVVLREEATDGALLELLGLGELDVTFADLPAPNGPFETFELVSDPYVLLVPADWPQAKLRRAVRLEDIVGLPLIGESARRPRVETALHAVGVEPRFVFHSDVGRTVQALVAVGLGAAILPRLTVEADSRTAVVELDGVLAVERRMIGLVWLKDRMHRAAASHFVDVATAFCAALEPDGEGAGLAPGALASS
jgi:DNA-binding transcriptional LysR family regulator